HPQIRYEEVHPKLNFYFSLPEDVYVSQYTLYSINRHCPGEKSGIAPANHDVQLLGEVFQPIFKNACPSPTEIGTGVTVNTKNVFVKKGEEIHGQYLNLWIAVPKGDFGRKFNQGMLQHTVKLKVRKRGKVPAPKIEWVEHCPFDKSEEVELVDSVDIFHFIRSLIERFHLHTVRANESDLIYTPLKEDKPHGKNIQRAAD
ncbi:hypothetical protein FF38_03699, partial [Lucilia cuprina]